MSEKVNFNVSGYVRHDGVEYGPGSTIEAIDAKQAQRLEDLGLGTIAPIPDPPGPIEYDKLKVEELKALAKEQKIEGYANMKKEELIEALTVKVGA